MEDYIMIDKDKQYGAIVPIDHGLLSQFLAVSVAESKWKMAYIANNGV